MKASKKQFDKSIAPDPLASPGLPERQSAYLSDSRTIFLLAALIFLVYSNSLSVAFVFDDLKQIVGNPRLASWGNLITAFSSDVWRFQRDLITKDIPLPYYRPLFTLYLTLGYHWFGLWEPGWHLMNLAAHILATVFTYYLLLRLSKDWRVAAIGSALFAVHPAHAESVSWISGIPDALASTFYIPALIWYLRYRSGEGKKWLILSGLFYGLSLLCKETPLALPVIIAIWEILRAKGMNFLSKLRDAFLASLPYLGITAFYLVIRLAVLGKLTWKQPMMAQVSDLTIWMTVPYVLITCLQHLIAPFRLSLIYGTPFIRAGDDPRFILPVLILLGAILVVWVLRRQINDQTWMALALLLAPLIPVLNLRVFHYEYIVQDRYLYLPSIGSFIYCLS